MSDYGNRQDDYWFHRNRDLDWRDHQAATDRELERMRLRYGHNDPGAGADRVDAASALNEQSGKILDQLLETRSEIVEALGTIRRHLDGASRLSGPLPTSAARVALVIQPDSWSASARNDETVQSLKRHLDSWEEDLRQPGPWTPEYQQRVREIAGETARLRSTLSVGPAQNALDPAASFSQFQHGPTSSWPPDQFGFVGLMLKSVNSRLNDLSDLINRFRLASDL